MPKGDALKPHQFKPGVSGNPGGKPKAKITINTIREIIERLSLLSRDELEKVIASGDTPVIELQLAAVMNKALKTGDYTGLAFILDRAVGKVTEVRENLNHDVTDRLAQEPRESLYHFLKKASAE